MIPESGRFGEGNGYPLQYSCLENPMDREAWWAIAHGGHKESDMTERLTLSNTGSWDLHCLICEQQTLPLFKATSRDRALDDWD